MGNMGEVQIDDFHHDEFDSSSWLATRHPNSSTVHHSRAYPALVDPARITSGQLETRRESSGVGDQNSREALVPP